MKPISISEQMMFTTVRLTAGSSCGTGFFYNFIYGDKYVPTIITNKHVVNNNPIEMVSFALHLMSEEGEPIENKNITLSTEWHFHSTHDLCFCYINSVLDKVREITGKSVFYIPITDSIIPSVEQLNDLSAIEEIVMIGYPIGLWDETNNFPIFRKGYTASHPAYDFNRKGIGLLDIAAFPGSSGSPVFILNENSYSDKKGNIFMNSNRIYFLGIQFAVPVYNAKGNIGVENIPTQQVLKSETPLMTNLAYYIKSDALKEFRDIIEKMI